jgi:glycine betaine catabolism B
MFTLLINTPTAGDTRVELSDERLQGEGVVLGRAPRSGVVLDDMSVSRSHARIMARETTVFIEDVGSSAGTSLNGVRLVSRQPTRLSPGDRVTIGSCTVQVQAPVSASDAAADSIAPTFRAEPPVPSYMPLVGIDSAGLTYWTGGEITVRVMRVVDETHDVKTFIFAAEPLKLFSYLPGQFMTLNLTINGKIVRRSYTISSTPSRPHLISVTVKRVAAVDGQVPGLVSNWLHDQLHVGDRITVSGPFGDFTCAKHPAPRLLLISGGSGITPMLSMTRWLNDTGASVDIVFLHSARSSQDLIARHELEVLANHNTHLRLIMITSRPEPGSGWLGISGRLNISLLAQAVPDYAARRIFCCGPEPFMTGVKDMMIKKGFDMERYHEESFGGAKKQNSSIPAAVGATPTPAYGLAAIIRGLSSDKGNDKSGDNAPVKTPTPPAGDQSGKRKSATPSAATLTCSRSKRNVSCPPSTPILEAVEGAGLSWPSGCRMGKCGACKAKVIGGSLDRSGYDDGVLSAADRAADFVLTCVGKPAGDMTLDL